MVMIGDFGLYFDESYSHAPDPLVYTVGGYVSTTVQWKKFQKEWRRILDAEGIRFFTWLTSKPASLLMMLGLKASEQVFWHRFTPLFTIEH